MLQWCVAIPATPPTHPKLCSTTRWSPRNAWQLRHNATAFQDLQLGLLTHPCSALKKGILQLKHSKPKPNCLTNTRLRTSLAKWITYLFAQGLRYSLLHLKGWVYRLQYSILWSLSISNAGCDQKAFWSMDSLQWFLFLPQKKGHRTDYHHSCYLLKSRIHFQKLISSTCSLTYKSTDNLCGMVSSSAVPCLLATSQILGHTQASPWLTVSKYKIV